MNIVKKKFDYDFTKEELSIFNAMSFKRDYKILGSNSIKNFLYPNDYDLYEKINIKNFTSNIKNVIEKLINMKNVYIGDIKIGEYDNEALRWKPKNILDGQLNFNNNTFSLLEASKLNGVKKLDVISYIDNVYKEFSIIYDDGKLQNNNLEDDIYKYLFDNPMKSIKRILSLEIERKTNKKLINKIINFVNSDSGILYNVITDINTLIYIIENINNFNKNKIMVEIDNFKNTLSRITEKTFLIKQKKIIKLINSIEKIKVLDNEYYFNNLHKIKEILQRILNRNCHKFLKSIHFM